MTHKFYKSTPEIYAQVQSCMNEQLYSKYIETGNASNILPVDVEPMQDGLVYTAIKLFICDDPLVETCVEQLTQITEEEYNQNTITI